MTQIVLALALFLAAPRTALIDAVKSSDHDALRALLKQNANINAAEGDGTTALHWASFRDDLDSADLLIRAGAKVNAANDLGVTPLWTAAQNGSEAMVRRLLTAGANPNTALLAGETPLMVAARSGNPAVVELLLGKGANINARGARAQTALMWAVAQKHPEVVKVLLAHHADISARTETWSEVMAVTPHGYLGYNKAIPHGNDTALLFAAREGDFESAKLLVAAGANVNDEDAWGVSATALAAHSGFTDIVDFLLNKGADANADKAGFSALHEAVMRRDEKLVKLLLDHGANANAPLRTWTPLRRTSADWHFEPELIGATPFWMAARFTAPGIMKLLVGHGADPLFVHNSDRVVEGRNGVAFEHHKESTTAVMAAAGQGGGGAPWTDVPRREREGLALEAVKLAVSLGVDVNAKNTDGRTALDSAKVLRFESVVAFLTEKGAKPGTGGGTGRPSIGK
jgi:ankyrin repeat protein